eukprot:gene7158-biopygen4122
MRIRTVIPAAKTHDLAAKRAPSRRGEGRALRYETHSPQSRLTREAGDTGGIFLLFTIRFGGVRATSIVQGYVRPDGLNVRTDGTCLLVRIRISLRPSIVSPRRRTVRSNDFPAPRILALSVHRPTCSVQVKAPSVQVNTPSVQEQFRPRTLRPRLGSVRPRTAPSKKSFFQGCSVQGEAPSVQEGLRPRKLRPRRGSARPRSGSYRPSRGSVRPMRNLSVQKITLPPGIRLRPSIVRPRHSSVRSKEFTSLGNSAPSVHRPTALRPRKAPSVKGNAPSVQMQLIPREIFLEDGKTAFLPKLPMAPAALAAKLAALIALEAKRSATMALAASMALAALSGGINGSGGKDCSGGIMTMALAASMALAAKLEA